ncbi:hypothetical protein EDD15DRAFT_2200613 [Pisolithus albus]|nr:hypothetical protein EDD15DRAFT_2200613 [Pisolithus albus]
MVDRVRADTQTDQKLPTFIYIRQTASVCAPSNNTAHRCIRRRVTAPELATICAFLSMVAILSGLELLPPKFWGLQVIMGWLIDHVGPVQGATGINPPWSRWRLFVPLGPPSGRYNSFGLKSALLDRSSILGSGGMSDHSIQSQDGGWKHPWRHCRKVMVSRLLNWPESRQRVCVASVSSKGGKCPDPKTIPHSPRPRTFAYGYD